MMATNRTTRAKDHTKILFLGDSEVGKTSLLRRYCDQTFAASLTLTVGVDFRMRNVTFDGVNMRLQIWDTAGQERFRSIGEAYYRGSEGIVVVFDLTRRESFEHIDRWISSIKSTVDDTNIPLLLLANKKDLKEARVIDPHQIEILAKSHDIPYHEVSAMTGENVEEALNTFAKNIYLQKQLKIQSQGRSENFVLSESVLKSESSQSSPNTSKSGCCGNS